MPRPGPLFSRWIVAAAALVLSAPVAVAAGAPAVAYWTEDATVVADAAGEEVRAFRDFERFSFAGGLLAGQVPGPRHSSDRVVGYDVETGDRLFRIVNATNPVVAASGQRVAFLPTFRREQYVRSVWMRNARGKVRKVVQFRAPGVDGVPHGMGGDGAPLDLALDASGRHMAVVFGLEPLRSFDVWVVDTKTGAAVRMTRGENSHNPSLSPAAGALAVRVERPESCPDPLYGEILVGKIRVVDVATRERRDLTEFDCDLFYDTPRWIDDASLVAVRVTKDASEELGYDLDLVRIDAASGEISDLWTEGNPCCVTASPSLGKVAFSYSDRSGFGVLDLTTGDLVDFDRNAPHLSGEGRT